MIAVIFEVSLRPGQRQSYLDMAAQLRERLSGIEGFLGVERFQSVADENKMLSLSFFRDEEAVARWRNTEAHRGAQGVGRSSLFADYRLRIAHVLRDYGLKDRAEAPADSRSVHG
jgi:heme-degrading monooxygenase HmoA